MNQYPITQTPKVEKTRLRSVPKKILSEEELRQQWIDNLTQLDYPDIPIEELKYRLRQNQQWQPGDYWCNDCHPKYAHLDETGRTKQFVKEMEYYMTPLPENGYSKKERKLFHRARATADSIKVKYLDYVAALVFQFGHHRMGYTVLNFRDAIDVYAKWVASGKFYPKPMPLLKLIDRQRISRRRDEKY
jgi:hypothetical protein